MMVPTVPPAAVPHVPGGSKSLCQTAPAATAVPDVPGSNSGARRPRQQQQCQTSPATTVPDNPGDSRNRCQIILATAETGVRRPQQQHRWQSSPAATAVPVVPAETPVPDVPRQQQRCRTSLTAAATVVPDVAARWQMSYCASHISVRFYIAPAWTRTTK